MKRILVAILIILAAGIASAQSPHPTPPQGCSKTLTVDQFLLPDDAAAAKQAFETFRDALLSGNREEVISQVKFPADLVLDGYGVIFKSPQEFEAKYDQLFTQYVISSVRRQKPNELVAGWEGVRLPNGAVKFSREENGRYLIVDIRSSHQRLPKEMQEFEYTQYTCKPVVVEGRVIAYDWWSHNLPGPGGIYIDHFVIAVGSVLSGPAMSNRIHADYWGAGPSPNYSLPDDVFKPGFVWRMYLRPADSTMKQNGICEGEVQENIPIVDEGGNETGKIPAITFQDDEKSVTFNGLPCFEVDQGYVYEIK